MIYNKLCALVWNEMNDEPTQIQIFTMHRWNSYEADSLENKRLLVNIRFECLHWIFNDKSYNVVNRVVDQTCLAVHIQSQRNENRLPWRIELSLMLSARDFHLEIAKNPRVLSVYQLWFPSEK